MEMLARIGPCLLKLSGISQTFDNGVQALGEIDLTLGEAEFVSLVGPSGCGKSTVLRLIAGLLRPTAGKVEWSGGKPEIGFVFQEATLMPWATALANTRLPLDLKHVPRKQSDERARAALARVSLSGFEDAFPRELSGGMKMRVSIARALTAQAKVLLLDEPFAALDELARQDLNDELLKLWLEDRLTVLFVTHSVYESAYLSSRVLAMTSRPGRIATEIALQPPRHRDRSYRLSQAFAEDARRISDALRPAIAGAQERQQHAE